MTTTPYLLVRVGERVAALPALAVRHVVLDLAQLLGEERRSSRPPETVVTWLGSGSDRELVGLGVDDAIEVTEIDAAALGVGQALVGGRPVLVVDLDRLGVEA